MAREYRTGSVFRRKDGRWVAKIIDPVTGKAVMQYARQQKDARALLRAMQLRTDMRQTPSDARVSFREYAEHWLEHQAGRRRRPATINEYTSRLRKHVFPVIGHLALARISVTDIERVLDLGRRNGLSEATAKGIRNAMGAVFSQAVKDRLIAATPMATVEMPTFPRGISRKFPSTLEVQQLVAQIQTLTDPHEQELGRIVLVCLHTGTRIGEVLAARWDDMTEDLTRWHVARTTTRDRQGRQIVGDRTKTGEGRILDLPGTITTILMEQRRSVLEGRGQALVWHDQGWVFPSSTGTVRDARNLRRFMRRTFPDWPYGFHEMRHWFVSVGLTTDGVGIAQVSRMVGHQSTRTTTDIYGHLLIDASQRVYDRVAETLERKN